MFTLLLLDRQLIDEEVYKQNVENYDQIDEKLSKLNEQITLCVSKKKMIYQDFGLFFVGQMKYNCLYLSTIQFH